MLVRQIMQPEVLTLEKGTPCRAAYAEFRRARVRRAPVVENGRLIGIVSERDLLRAMPTLCGDATGPGGAAWEHTTVEQVMTASVDTVSPSDPIEVAARLIVSKRFGGLPVVEKGGKVIGIVTTTDLVALLARHDAGAAGARLMLQSDDEQAIGPLIDKVRSLGLEITELTQHGLENGATVLFLGVELDDPRTIEALIDAAWASGWRLLESRVAKRAS